MEINYLTLDILILIFPLLFSFKWVFPYYKNFKSLGLSILIVGGGYILWDILVTYRGDWAFNKDYLVGIKITSLPIEEILFFIVVPYSCIFIYENLNHFFTDKSILYNKWIYYFLTIIFIFIGLFFYQQEYTILAMFSVAFFFFTAATWFPDILQSRNFWIYILISFFAFVIFNYLLTSIPIVTYDPEAIWGGTVQQVWNGRFITIPYEDFFYNFSMLSFYLLVYIHFKKSLIKSEKVIKKIKS